MDDPNKQNLLINGLLSGRIVQTGIGLVTAATVNAAKNKAFPGKEKIRINFGETIVQYNTYPNCDFLIGKKGVDCLRFYNESSEILFFAEDSKKMQEKISSICRMISSASISMNENEPANDVGKDNFEIIKNIKNYMTRALFQKKNSTRKSKSY